MLPTESDLHVNRPLTNMSVAFMQSLLAFQADNLAPIMPSDKKSDLYFILNKEYWFSDVMKERGIGAPAIRRGWGVSQDSFLCKLFSLGTPIDDQQRANQDSPLDMDRTSMKFVSRASLMNREVAFKNVAWATGKWNTDITGNTNPSDIAGASTMNQWDQADSTPIDDIEEMKTIMEKKTGFTPNVLAISKPVWAKLKSNVQILDRITGGSTSNAPAKVTLALVAALFELDEIVVLNAVQNLAGHGNGDSGVVNTIDGDYIFGADALLMYRDPTVGIETPTAIRTITWQQYAGNKNGTRMLKWRDESIHSDIIEVESTYVHKIVAPDMGIFVNGAIAG